MEYSHMQPTVDTICKSMLETPQDWVIGVHTVKHKPSGIEYWLGSRETSPIIEMWNGHSTEVVFSQRQGGQIREAFDRMMKTKVTRSQRKLMKMFDPTPQVIQYIKNIKRPWWKFW